MCKTLEDRVIVIILNISKIKHNDIKYNEFKYSNIKYSFEINIDLRRKMRMIMTLIITSLLVRKV